ncbi:SGNH hydrolase-type esterase domain-containing protein [Chaetomium fimeti]|uniref:SGNH hydrolase-type esterase domain-containing protein n=1 Tax=Chaetomium fimeti TaxID=1854472 RepID=A0AAE0LN93_9PEZI|nr:SGNH hydrolase-type esterase domain-containing protein [Chaetomium fimeti]
MRLLGFTLVAGLAASAYGQKVKVMLLGDSITEITCWRPMVWDQLTTAGLAGNVDFVGTMSNLQGSCSKPSGFDVNHEGHSGWQAYDIARNNIEGWVQNTKPDIVQFMLGTNDVNIGKRNAQSILESYTTMLNAMRAANPSVKVIIDKLIPTSWSDATVEAVNTAIPGWVSSHTTSESPIVIADCSRAAGFTNAMLRGDGVHPNDQGDRFIAEQVGPKLIELLSGSGGGGGGDGGGGNPAATTTAGGAQPTAGCAALWGQCGGLGWAGPSCCSQGACRVSNDYYSQCQ